MELYFPGPEGHLVLLKETAANVLRAMGYTGDVDAGEIPLVDAYIGAEQAKRTLSGHELQVLITLICHMDELSEEFIENLEWA